MEIRGKEIEKETGASRRKIGDFVGPFTFNSPVSSYKLGDSLPLEAISCECGGQPTHQSSLKKTLEWLYII